jgi:protocatechuate 3,4-dioxygenase beta subunit
MNLPNLPRRSFISTLPFFVTPGLMAEALTLTPKQTEGPFYPDKMPLDTDNDLIIINNSLTPAVGTVAYLTGKVTDIKGNPIRNALVEIWQVDNNGIYIHSRGGKREKLDSNFQGYGKFLTDSKGNYSFRTLKPSPYSGRTPHIHMAVSAKGKRKLTTQCYVKGEPRNKKDFILKRVKDSNARNSLIVPFNPLPSSKLGEVKAQFDIVLGWTPES